MMPQNKKHQPPSKKRYAEKHPSVTIHLTLDEYNALMELALNNDKSMNQLLKESVGLKEETSDTFENKVRGETSFSYHPTHRR